MIEKLIGLVLAVGIASVSVKAENFVQLDFSSPEIRKAVAACPGARVEKDREGIDTLIVEVPPGKEGGNHWVSIPLDLKAMNLNGKIVYGEAFVTLEKVSIPEKSYSGAKLMLPVKNEEGKWKYPEFMPLGGREKWGTCGWHKVSGRALVPEGTDRAILYAGLQDASGKVAFKAIRLYAGDNAPRSVLSEKSITKLKYTVNPPIQRGAMYPGRLQEEDFVELRKWGGNSMRWQFSLYGMEKHDLSAIQSRLEKYLEELGKALCLAQKYHIMLTIDLHADKESMKTLLGTQAGRDYLADFWKRLASRYKGDPAIFGYNLINEPDSRILPQNAPSLNELYGQLISDIRKIDPVTPIIIEPDYMSAPDMISYLPLYDFPNLIYSVHAYFPMEVTHQLNPKAEKFNGYPDAEKGWDKEYLRKSLKTAREFQLKTGARIYVGEFGCIRWAPGAAQWYRDCIELFEEYHWDWAYHAYREWSGWSVEHSDDPKTEAQAPMTERKKVMLKAFEKNLTKEESR